MQQMKLPMNYPYCQTRSAQIERNPHSGILSGLPDSNSETSEQEDGHEGAALAMCRLHTNEASIYGGNADWAAAAMSWSTTN